MKRLIGVILLFFVVFYLVLIIFPKQKQKNVCYISLNGTEVLMDLCPKDVKDVNITIYENLTKYKYFLLFFNPEGRGNYTVALLNLKLKIPKIILVCKNYHKKCNLYLEKETNKSYVIKTSAKYYDIIYEFPKNISKGIYLILSNKTCICEKGNSIYLIGNNRTIRKVVDRFIYYWYGIN